MSRNKCLYSNDTPTTEIYTLSLHDALPISHTRVFCPSEIAEPLTLLIAAAERLERARYRYDLLPLVPGDRIEVGRDRSEEHTSELQSQSNLVCRLLLEKKNTTHRMVSTSEE